MYFSCLFFISLIFVFTHEKKPLSLCVFFPTKCFLFHFIFLIFMISKRSPKKYFWLWKPERSEEKKSAWKRTFMFKQSFFYSYFQENFVSSCVKPKLNEKIMEKIIKFHSVENCSFVCEKKQTVCSFSRIFFSWNCFLHMFSLIEKWLRNLKRLSGKNFFSPGSQVKKRRRENKSDHT